MRRIILITIVLLLGVFISSSFAAKVPVYGPEVYTKTGHRPTVYRDTFTISGLSGPGKLIIANQGDKWWKRVRFAKIWLNGQVICKPHDFKRFPKTLQKVVNLQETNKIKVKLWGWRGKKLTLEVSQIDNEPPIIEASISPPPNEHGWHNDNVTVSFTCDDAISGIFSCTEPVTIESEGKEQIVAGTATDNAGNTKEVSVTVNIDKTPPSIARSWPPDDNFGTGMSKVEIEGEFSDDLSGMNKAELWHDTDIAILPMPSFSVIRALDTDIPPGDPWQNNEFKIEATDQAGNSIRQIFFVRYTLGLTVSPTDPERTELVDGLKTSVDRAIVRFLLSADRDRIDGVIGEEGGRVAGFLPAGNIAIAEFETEAVMDLKDILNSLKNRDMVDVAIPVIFPPTLAFDNNNLPNQAAAAYDNIKGSEASQLIIDSGISLNPVNIAVIETGMDDTYGQNNEFADINFYNLCTPEGQQGQTGTPVDRPDHHGTKISGILAGANNGSGNNGVIRGIASSQFDVNVFRMNCDGSNDPTLVLAALDMIIDGTVGDIDVVNMSFGYFAGSSAGDIYEGYFDSVTGQDILWVGGAGNDDQQIACNEFFPSGLACDLDNVISVGAYNPDDLIRGRWWSETHQRWYGSNYGEGVTISAPGTDVWTATGTGTGPQDPYYDGVNGTSASTPLVTGAAALMLAVNPMSPPAVKQLLVNTTQPLNGPDLPEGGLDILALLKAGWVVYVASNGDCGGNSPCYSTLQDGINAINGYGGTVKVSQGTYNENIEMTSSKNGLLIQGGWHSDFTTMSEDAALTTIDGDTNGDGTGDGRVFDISARESTKIELTIEGFTITNGIGGVNLSSYQGGMVTSILKNNIIDGNEDFDGGGVRIYAGVDNSIVTAVLENSTVANNFASSYHGGGIYAQGKGTIILRLNNSSVTDNSAGEYGGGIYASSLSGFGGSVTLNLHHNVITNNISGNSGGGVYAGSGHTILSFSNNVIAGNSAIYDGGGIVIFNNYSGTNLTTITNNTIENNTAGIYGGGINIDTYVGTTDVTLFNNTITDNNATYGGGVNMLTNETANIFATIINSIFANNEAEENGGAISNYNSSPIITNSTFYSNFADIVGGAIYNDNSKPTIKNCILWGDNASASPEIYNLNSTPTVTYSDVAGGYAGSGNINFNPLFVDPTNGDFHLLVGSPCINTGTSNGAPSIDIENISRPQGTGYDMGAYEFR